MEFTSSFIHDRPFRTPSLEFGDVPEELYESLWSRHGWPEWSWQRALGHDAEAVQRRLVEGVNGLWTEAELTGAAKAAEHGAALAALEEDREAAFGDIQRWQAVEAPPHRPRQEVLDALEEEKMGIYRRLRGIAADALARMPVGAQEDPIAAVRRAYALAKAEDDPSLEDLLLRASHLDLFGCWLWQTEEVDPDAEHCEAEALREGCEARLRAVEERIESYWHGRLEAFFGTLRANVKEEEVAVNE